MARPFRKRWINCRPGVRLFKPAGVPGRRLRTTEVHLDELEAIRLVDAEGLDQVGAAGQMRISRATVGRILERARRKVAHALVNGEALAIEPGKAPIEYRAAKDTCPRHSRGRREQSKKQRYKKNQT